MQRTIYYEIIMKYDSEILYAKYQFVCCVGYNLKIKKCVWSEIKYQRTNGPVNAHLSLLHIPINMFEYYGI